ncbi:MAG: PQQ-dependent dehydrogenase, methanol/ethanol family [Blastocatellia bacterium]|nr:MAG: PQQ-dependent dehydrogenase, methanol/ethanol family [Blastocatellia bacterium]
MMKRTLLLLTVAVVSGVSLRAQVSFERLLRADTEPQNWLTHSGTLRSQRYSLLTQITPENVKNLEPQWVFQSRSLEKFEVTPLVVDGIMYLVQPPNDLMALDAATGRTFWMYSYRNSADARPCCGRVNRGVAILGDTLFMGTIDGHLVAIDAKGGRPIWDVKLERPEAGYALTVAPLVVKDKVIVGTAGGEYGIRGFLAAYDAKTGKEAWRFYTIAGPGEAGRESWGGDSWKTGGGSIWVTGSYDPESNLTYWGVGNAGPDWNGDSRPGDNLYTSSVVALDADSGKLKWHYQFSPHDEFDYDATQVPVLGDIQWQGAPRKVMMWANRNGFFYVLDRTTGQFLSGKPFVRVNWAEGFDQKGRPNRVPGMIPTTEGTVIYPGNQGGTNWYNPSFSPRTGLFYIPSWVNYSSLYVKRPQDFVEGRSFGAGGARSTVAAGLRTATSNLRKEEEGYGAIRAIDPLTGDRKWEYKMADFTDAGILTTASDLLFSGGREGFFYALDARTGTLLWKFTVGGQVQAGPMTYAVGGRQYVAVAAGNSLFTFALRQ